MDDAVRGCGVPGARSLAFSAPGLSCALGCSLADRSRPSIRVVPARFRAKGQGLRPGTPQEATVPSELVRVSPARIVGASALYPFPIYPYVRQPICQEVPSRIADDFGAALRQSPTRGAVRGRAVPRVGRHRRGIGALDRLRDPRRRRVGPPAQSPRDSSSESSRSNSPHGVLPEKPLTGQPP